MNYKWQNHTLSILLVLGVPVLLIVLLSYSPTRLLMFAQQPLSGRALWPDAHLPPYLSEVSGVVKSLYGDFYWMHNDSGDGPYVYPVRVDGSPVKKTAHNRIRVSGAEHYDWEDMTSDRKGTLYIGDFGNNANNRPNIVIYKVREPSSEATQTQRAEVFRFYYPEQTDYPAKIKNFDAEALVYLKGELFLFTKNRADRNTSMYHLPLDEPETLRKAEFVLRIDNVGKIAAAAVSEDQEQLALLSSDEIFLFNTHGDKGRWFTREVRQFRFRARQCEALCFIDGETLLMANEYRELFYIPLSHFETLIP